MRAFFDKEPEAEDGTWRETETPYGGWQPGGMPDLGWFDSLRSLWQWDEVAAEIGQESRARIALAGLPNAGKSLLFNRLRGWDFSDTTTADDDFSPTADVRIEPFGFFVLADLPPAFSPMETAENLVFSLGDPALLVYILDATAGVRPADYRWVATLRASGKPLVAVLNKVDLLPEHNAAVSQAEQRLGMPVIPISALSGANISERFLPALLDAAPRLAVPLGRELSHLRRLAARRVIRQVALFAGMMGAQPIPLLDLPFQAILQVGMVLRIGAAYGRTPTGGINREIVSTVVTTLGLRYLAASLAKFVPLLGWVVSGIVSITSTAAMGEVAIRYYEAGGTIPLPQLMARVQRSRDEEVTG
jgi:uncharacterized protein (DUF697 family)